MKIGCHVSIAGGIEKSIYRAKRLEINTMQIFSKNSRTWQEKTFSKSEIFNFQKALRKTDINPVFVHASYLINLASPEEEVYLKSITSFIEEMKRADQLLADTGTPFLIIHPGAHRGSGEEYGLGRIVDALKTILKKSTSLNLSTVILLENTSGMGSSLGYNFRQLGYIIEETGYQDKIGVCFDTCHGFAAGYNLADERGLEEAIVELDREVGLERLKVIHINDSKNDLNSRKDRHAHIGEGFIGLKGFERLVNHKLLKDLPYILETPKKNDDDDLRNISIVRGLRG